MHSEPNRETDPVSEELVSTPEITQEPASEASAPLTDPPTAAPKESSPATSPEPVAEAPAEPSLSEAPAPVVEEKSSTGIDGLRVQIGSLGDPTVSKETKAQGNASEPGPMVTPLDEYEIQLLAVQNSGEDASSKHPPPKITRDMTPELEKEIEDALGGLSLEEMLTGGASGGATIAEGDLEPETKIKARVVTVHREDVFVDLGIQHQGMVSLKQFSEPPEVGAELELMVSRWNQSEGLYEMTLPGAAVAVEDWSDVEEGLVVQAIVTGHNKGGLECKVNSLRGFMPISQIALYRVEDLEPFVGESFPALVTEAKPEQRNLVLSRRAVLEREKEESRRKMLETLAVGQTHEGVVRNLQPFGAFVDIGGADGLIHISALSWDRVSHPSEVLEIGQKVKVQIAKYDRETGKIGLSYQDLGESPWKNVPSKYGAGTMVQGTVSKIMDFGAFVKLEPGVEGLIHISEISHQRVHRTSDVLSEGQTVEVQVLTVDVPAQRIGLSMKALEARPTTISKEKQLEEAALDALEAANPAKKKSTGPLKGGLGRPSGGEALGLNW